MRWLRRAVVVLMLVGIWGAALAFYMANWSQITDVGERGVFLPLLIPLALSAFAWFLWE